VVSSGLLYHKSVTVHPSGSFLERHAVAADSASFRASSWYDNLRQHLSASKWSDIIRASGFCSGIEAALFRIESGSHSPSSLTSPLESLHATCASLDLFSPHVPRVPRDVDGKLIANKDAGCAPPSVLDGEPCVVSSLLTDQALTQLDDYGFALIRNVVSLSSIRQLRADLRIKSSYMTSGSSEFTTRDTDPEVMFSDERAKDVSYTQLASGRYAYQLRCSELENVVKPIHAVVMPIVWEFLAREREEGLPAVLATGDTSKPPARVFLSSVSLVCSDPLSGEDSWHGPSGGGGVSVLIPLTPAEPGTGGISLIPASHKSWDWPVGITRSLDFFLREGGAVDVDFDCGDILVVSGKTMRRTLRNTKYNKSKIWIAFQYDWVDKPAPYQWLPTTLVQNAIAAGFVRMDRLYKRLPGRLD
jgi:hypothetical protein